MRPWPQVCRGDFKTSAAKKFSNGRGGFKMGFVLADFCRGKLQSPWPSWPRDGFEKYSVFGRGNVQSPRPIKGCLFVKKILIFDDFFPRINHYQIKSDQNRINY